MTNEQFYIAIAVPMLFNAGLFGLVAVFFHTKFRVIDRHFDAIGRRFDALNQRLDNSHDA
ncbi:MAG TPA: hypothetical protein VEU51_12615 [Candidatus Acidoferrales bacterium]|nr:hypothetical protein [Candidatus Acidoferrales bacterium]